MIVLTSYLKFVLCYLSEYFEPTEDYEQALLWE